MQVKPAFVAGPANPAASLGELCILSNSVNMELEALQSDDFYRKR